MLTPDVRLEGFAVDDWARLLSLFQRAPAAATDRAARETREKGGLVLVHDDARVHKLLHTRVGRLDPSYAKWPTSLDVLATEHRAAWAVALRTGALDEIMERFGARAQPSDDIVQQALCIAQIVREMAQAGTIAAWPAKLRTLTIPSYGLVVRALDSICPDGRAVLLGLFDQGELWTAVALRRRGRGIDAILGPDELRAEMGLLSGDWRRDYRHLAHVVTTRLGPLAAGLFTETQTLRALLSENAPGGWARATAVRDIVVAPMSAALAIPLLLDALRGAFAAAKTIGERYDPTGKLALATRLLTGKRGGERNDDEAKSTGLLDTLRKRIGR